MKRGKIEFLVFSDPHIHEFSQYSEDNAIFTLYGINSFVKFTDVNSRLYDIVKALDCIKSYAYDRSINNILFCGDLCHSKKNITKNVMNVMCNWFRGCEDLNFILIPGNHDFSDKQGKNHSLQAIRDLGNVDVLDYLGSSIDFGSQHGKTYTRIAAFPYTEDKEEFTKAFNDFPTDNSHIDYHIAIAHTGIQGARVGSDYVMVKDHDVDTGKLKHNKYDACFFGHYHEHQKVFQNGWVCGALTEHNWSDSGGTRGFLHVTIEDGNSSVKHIPVSRDIPRFKLLDNNSSLEDIKPWDFIRYKTSESITQEHKDNIEGMIAAACGEKPKWLEIIPEAKNENKEEFVLSSKATSAETVLDEWVNHSNIESLPQEKVLQIGKEILSEAQNSLL